MSNIRINANIPVNDWELKNMSVKEEDLAEVVHQKFVEEQQRRQNEAFVYNEMLKSSKRNI
jgi:hypothetical protein